MKNNEVLELGGIVVLGKEGEKRREKRRREKRREKWREKRR
jgi:hypothetical protein